MSALVVLVTGARGNAVPRELVEEALDAVSPAALILGDCPSGVDLWAYWWGLAREIPLDIHIADWNKWGAAAGPRRNGFMVAAATARAAAGDQVIVLAFPRGGPGTLDCITKAEAAGLSVERL